MPASSRPKLVSGFIIALYFSDRNVNTCMRVVLCQTKNGLPSSLAFFMKSIDLLDQGLVEGGHVVFGVADTFAFAAIGRASGVRAGRERAFVDDLLLADLAPARLDGRVVGVARAAMNQVARADGVSNGRIGRVRIPVRIGHGIEVIEIAEELVEAVDGRQVLVQVAEVVLAELAGGVAHRLQARWRWWALRGQADIGAGLADGGHSGADRQLAGDEVGAAGGAARLGVVVGEAHAFRGEPVEVRRLARHDTLVVGADVEPADIVAHDDKDVGL